MDNKIHTTTGIKLTTKGELNTQRVAGQSCNGFICQLADFWARKKGADR